MSKSVKIKNSQLIAALKLGKKEPVAAPAKKTRKRSSPEKEKSASKNIGEVNITPAKKGIKAKSRSSFEVPEEVVVEKKTVSAEKGESEPSVKEEIIDELAKQSKTVAKEEPPEKKETENEANMLFVGPTGRHVDDLLPPASSSQSPSSSPSSAEKTKKKGTKKPEKEIGEDLQSLFKPEQEDAGKKKKGAKKGRKELAFSNRSGPEERLISTRDELEKHSEYHWRRKPRREKKEKTGASIEINRPKELSVVLPVTVKELAMQMKLKAAEIISKLFLQGMHVTINDLIDDEAIVQIIGEEFGCQIQIDSILEEKMRITDKSIEEEIGEEEAKNLTSRIPVIAFMGHVDHGKTSLIDFLRKSSLAAQEKGAITQHVGTFLCQTDKGAITILDTPGHEAFSDMRERGAKTTDIVILVVAGDEGIKEQTKEALQQAKEAGCSIIVAINKCDKASFDAEKVYRQLSENDLVPEVWGGEVVTVNCSATTGEGVPELLDLVFLKSELLEFKANTKKRARGVAIETFVQKGLGNMATVLVQNGTLHLGDALVFDTAWGKVKTMSSDRNETIQKALPGTPAKITGLSEMPLVGEEFIVVQNEKEAKTIFQMRERKRQEDHLGKKDLICSEKLLQTISDQEKKTLRIILRTDATGSLEAIENALKKIKSDKVNVEIVSANVGEVSASDIQLAEASKATIIGFHTVTEKHAIPLIKSLQVDIRLHHLIYDLISDIQQLMLNLLDQLVVEEEKGTAKVVALFKGMKSSKVAGSQMIKGAINQKDQVRLMRNDTLIWKGKIASIRREKQQVAQVEEGNECGILLKECNQIQEGDLIVAYETQRVDQEL